MRWIDIPPEPVLYLRSSDKMSVNYSAKNSSAKASDWSWDKNLDKQTSWPEQKEDASPANDSRAIAVNPLAQNSERKSYTEFSSAECSPSPVYHFNKARVNNVSLDSSSEQSMTGSPSSTTTDSVTYTWEAPMTKILPRLYIGSYDNAMDEPKLKWTGITHILSLVGKSCPVDFVEQQNIPMHDLGRTDLKGVIEKVSKFIKLGQEAGNKILIHCLSGQNRSASVVIGYRMIYHKETLYNVHKRLKSLRPLVQINVGYAKQLLALEKEIFGKNSLPSDWMERGEFNLITGEVEYKHENVNSVQHREMYDSKQL